MIRAALVRCLYHTAGSDAVVRFCDVFDFSLGLSPDPFLWHDHENFLAELAELDNLKNELPSASRASPGRS